MANTSQLSENHAENIGQNDSQTDSDTPSLLECVTPAAAIQSETPLKQEQKHGMAANQIKDSVSLKAVEKAKPEKGSRMHTSLKFVTLVRCMYATLVSIYSVLWFFFASDVRFRLDPTIEIMIGCLAEIFLFTGFCCFCLLKKKFIFAVTIFGMLNDALLAAVIVLLTGYYSSPFQYLLLIIPLYGGITLRKKGGLIGAFCVFIAVTLLFFLPEMSLLVLPENIWNALFAFLASKNEIFYRFFVLVIASVGVGFLTGHLAHQYARVQENLIANEREFKHLQGIYEQIIKALPIGVVIVNSNHDCVLYANPEAEKMLGSSSSNILSAKFQKPSGGEGSFQSKTSWVVQNGDKYLRLARFEMALPGIGSLNGYHVTDVTQIQLAQLEQVRKQRLVLLGEFSSKVAHEIRNPLACVSGCSEMLLQDDLDKDEQHQILEMMGCEIDRLNALLNDILVFSRRPKLSVKCLNLLKFFETRKNIFMSDVANKDIHIELNIPQEFDINVDENSISQIVMTLWRNSAEAINGHGELKVSMQDGAVQFEDSGPGIRDEVAVHIFEPFYTTKSAGTGLGLAIARQLALDNHLDLQWNPDLQAFLLKIEPDSAVEQTNESKSE